MNSKEIVTRAIEFKRPDRLPMQFSLCGRNDCHSVAINQNPFGDITKKESLDEWGCTWTRLNESDTGQCINHPLEDYDSYTNFKFPDPNDEKYYKDMEKQFEGSDGKYVSLGYFSLLFERMHFIRGFENVLTDLILEREKIEMLADQIVEFDIGFIRNVSKRFPGMINGFFFTDDWGTQEAAFIDPNLWNDFFMPRYKKIFDACKDAGWHVWMHSCGKVNEIIPGLIKAGVDVLNLLQPRALGIEEIGSKFAGKVCFNTGIDIQHTLPLKGKKEIKEEAKLILDHWTTENGGLIIFDYVDEKAVGTTNEKRKWMFEAFNEYDPFKKM